MDEFVGKNLGPCTFLKCGVKRKKEGTEHENPVGPWYWAKVWVASQKHCSACALE